MVTKDNELGDVRATLAKALQGVSKQAIAEAAGIHRPNLYRLLAPGSNPTLDVLERVAAALGFELIARPVEKTRR